VVLVPFALFELGVGVDELSAHSGLSASEVAARLTMLELRGLVERRAGGTFAAVSIRRAKNDARA